MPTEPLPPVSCSREQCKSDDVTTLHNGYVAHRNADESACDRSREGHRRYVAEKRRSN